MSKSPSAAQRGQTLIMFVLAAGVLLGLTALAIDVGLIFHERRAAQNAADAAALAAVAKLPPFGLPGEPESVANDWAKRNGYESGVDSTSVTVQYPYNADASKIEVEIERPFSLVFGRVLGLDQTGISARAVAQATFSVGSGGGYAIFVINNNCSASDPLEVSGSDVDVTGLVHSNSKVKIGGSNDSFNGATTYSCSFSDSGSNNSFTPSPAQTDNRTPPLDYSYSDFPCDYSYTEDVDLSSKNELWVNNDPSTLTLKDAVICSTKDLQISVQGARGNVTLVAGDEIKLSGSNMDLKGLWHDVLAFSAASHDSTIDMSGSGGSWEGYIYSPDGRVKIQGQNDLSVKGSIVADRVSISGSDFSIDSTLLGTIWPGPGAARLIE
jgi:hypothetical protein